MHRRVNTMVGALCGLALLSMCVPSVSAEDRPTTCPICGRTVAATTAYPEKAGSTLVRGAANTIFGWTELIQQPVAAAKSDGNVFTGLAQGVGHTVKRTLNGLGDVLTFWTPKLHGQYVHFATDCPVCRKEEHLTPSP